MSNLSKNQFLIISLLLFSMFFGAGNFIFPPMVGLNAGENLYGAMLAFGITAVLLPILGIAAVAKSGGIEPLTRRVGVLFSLVFTIIIYLIIGPFLAIPRAANMPFEASKAIFDGGSVGLLIYTAFYFYLNYKLCLNKNTMVTTIGKVLTPMMLVLLLIFFISGFVILDGNLIDPSPKYATSPLAAGFMDGYSTMDAMASLVFGLVIITAMRNFGIKNSSNLVSSTIKAGILAGSILMLVYFMLGWLGAHGAQFFPNTKNGVELLANLTNKIFGNFGSLILTIIFLLACFTTTVGLISSASEYFAKFKLNYKTWVIIWSIISFIISNNGLDAILNFSIPILNTIYPVTIVLIILGLINNFIDGSKLIYATCAYTTSVIAIIQSVKFEIPLLTNLVKSLPFYELEFAWLVPSIIGFIISYIISVLKK